MDDFIELILELIIDGSIEALPNKKIPKILRIIIALIPISFLIGLIILGILLLRFCFIWFTYYRNCGTFTAGINI